MRQQLRTAAVIAASAVAVACSLGDDAQTREQIQALTAAPSAAFVDSGRRGALAWQRTRELYSRRSYRPAWIEGRRPTRALDALIDTLARADRHGLTADDYDSTSLVAERRRADSEWLAPRFDRTRVAAIDAHATYAFLRLADDLLRGRVLPRDVSPLWDGHTPQQDLTSLLSAALDEDRVAETLAGFAPVHPQYWLLQQALEAQRQALASEDAGSVGARRIQRRIAQIEMNLDRWRWLPRDYEDRYVLVNIPAYELHAIEQGEPVHTMRVIVGAPDSPTPVFNDRMTYIAFSPYWNIPESILRDETIPRVIGDPDYLGRNGIEIVRTSGDAGPVDPAEVDWTSDLATQGLRLRQVPGPENALGLVKFIFPNRFSIYLHDTPSGALFAEPGRALSHGCVRVEHPVTLAQWVLADQPAWTEERIAGAMAGHQETVVHIDRPVAVHLGYWTAWVRADGRLTFTGDPYGVEARHARARERVPGPARSAAPR